jgi:transcriptional regulator with XRE-family HTH domain
MDSTLGQRLRALRHERGLSQAELAGDLVSPSYVSLIESSRRSPERDVLEGLARRLGCSTLYLESGVEPEEINEQRLKLQFAEIALANGSVAEARERFAELAQVPTSEIRNGAIWGLARTDEAQGELRASLMHLDVLVDEARLGAPGAPGLLGLLMARCRLYKLAGDFARSIEVGEDALREVRELGLEGTEEEIKLASTLVMCYWGRGDLFSAQQLASQVIERADKLGSRTAQGSAYWNAALVAEAHGQIALALDLASRTLALLSESSLIRSLASIRVTYAWLLLRCDPPRIDEAEALLVQAHETFADMSLSQNLASCETEMARCALLRGAFAEAAQLAADSMARCADTSTTELESARVVKGLAQIMSGQAVDGVAAVSSAADFLEQMGARAKAAQAWRELAEALIRCDRLGQAIDALRRAADCAGVRSTSLRADPAQARVTG